MKVSIDSGELLRITNRHKAKTLKSLEDINCPEGYLTIVRNGIDYLRNDLVDMASNNRG